MQAARLDERRTLERFKAKTRGSAELHRRAIQVMPGGVMAGIKFFEPYPVFMNKARGSRVWDVDGNEYVDYLMSYGALILGHGHPAVKRSLEAALQTYGTTVIGTPSRAELEYGETLRDIYHKDGLLRFTNSGLESTLLAVRLARAFTGKKMVAKFEGHYHGAVDRLLFSCSPEKGAFGRAESPGPIADSADVDESILSESLVLPFNDWAATESLLTKASGKLACVIMEPFEEGVIAGEKGFMKSLRGLTNDLRIPLIFDEVKTGFRVKIGGATEYYGIVPDVACLGKIIGGGLPIGAVVGEREIMGLLDPRRESWERVFHSGTFNGNPLSLTVGMTTVEELRGPSVFEKMCATTENLKRSFSALLDERQISHIIAGEGAMFNIYITDGPVRSYRDTEASDLRFRRFLDLELIARGVYLKPENRFCLSTAHTAADVDLTKQKFAESLDAILATGPS